MSNVRRLQLALARMRSVTHVRRVHSETIVCASGEHRVYKPRTIYRRYLDGLENRYFEYYKRNLIGAQLCMLTKSEVPLKEETVRRALALLCRRQTLLRARVIESSGGVSNYYESVSGIDAHKVNLYVVDRGIDERLAVWEELANSMDYERNEGCLWKAVLLREKFDQNEQCYYNALITNVCHSVADAGSIISLNRQLLDFIEMLAQGHDVKLSDVKELPLFPSPTPLLAPKLREFEKRAQEEVDIHPLRTSSNVLDSFPKCTDRELCPYPVTKVMLRNIAWSDLEKLVKICRKHDSTLTGLLTATAHIAFSRLLDPMSLPEDATSDIMSYVNTSRYYFFALPEGYPTNGISSLEYYLPTSQEGVWPLASAFSKQLRADVANSRHFATILKANQSDAGKIVENSLKEGALPVNERKKSHQILSNPLPIFTKPDPTKIFSIAEVFGGSPVHCRASTFGDYTTTLNGNMNYITVYDGSMVSAKVAQDYYDCVTQLLDNVLQSDEDI